MILAIFICVLWLAMCFVIGLWFDGFDNLESGSGNDALCGPYGKAKRPVLTATRDAYSSALHSLSGREKHNLRRVLLARISERRK